MGAAASTKMGAQVTEAELRNIAGIAFDEAAFKDKCKAKSAGESCVSKEDVLKYVESKGLGEPGKIFIQNVKTFMDARTALDNIFNQNFTEAITYVEWKGTQWEDSWAQMDARNKPAEYLDRADKNSPLDGLYVVAKAILPVFKSVVKSAIKEAAIPENQGRFPPLKSKKRATQKVMDEYDGQYFRIMDVVRCSIVCTSENQMVDLFNSLAGNPQTNIIRVKNRFNPPTFNGYRDLLLTIKITANVGSQQISHMCELQVHHQAIKECDELKHSHVAYEYFRTYFSGDSENAAKEMSTLNALPIQEGDSAETLVKRMLSSDKYSAADLWNVRKLVVGPMAANQLEEDVLKKLVEMTGGSGEGGPDSKDRADAIFSLAFLLKERRARGQYSHLFSRALEMRKNLLASASGIAVKQAHLDYSQALLNHAKSVYVENLEGSNERAYDLLSEAQEGFEKSRTMVGPANMNGLGMAAECVRWKSRIRKYQEIYTENNGDAAVPLAQKALEMYIEAYGRNNAEVAIAMNHLAICFESSSKDYTASEKLKRESLAIRKRIFGDEHPAVAMQLNNLSVCISTGRGKDINPETGELGWNECEHLYEEVLAVRVASLGRGHYQVASAHFNIGMIKVKQNKKPASLENFKAAYDIADALGMDSEKSKYSDTLKRYCEETGTDINEVQPAVY